MNPQTDSLVFTTEVKLYFWDFQMPYNVWRIILWSQRRRSEGEGSFRLHKWKWSLWFTEFRCLTLFILKIEQAWITTGHIIP